MATAGTRRIKRDSNICYPQPSGIAHKSTPDTADAFLADIYYSDTASSAKNPLGFTSAFLNTKASANAPGYLGNFHVVIAGSNGYVGTATQRGFRIKTDGSGTNMDGRWLAVSPGEGAAIALNPVEYKAQTSIFQFGTDGSLVQIAPKTGMAGVAPNQSGKWDFLQYRAVGRNMDYIKCSGDNLIVCTSKLGFQYAGVCPGRKQSISGLLYFGLPEEMPKVCYWIGLYVDTDVSGVAT
ncbi:hypothetical protein SLS59_009108 [Nothophoma quercina]|uniref:Uncharacterized protein n=1 Tax=Nothophoma quercina TaxID=749835 RepID=A0ABR3QNX2_9PLEO